jgi:hypothetical protein
MKISNIRLLTIIVIFALIIYILYSIKYRKNLILISPKKTDIIEGSIDQQTAEAEAVSKEYVDFTTIVSVPDSLAGKPLHEYCIKSSYNTACSGKYVSIDMIKNVLSRGCRFVDFEVFYIKESGKFIPKVGVSSDENYILLDSKNSIRLNEVFATITKYAFSQDSPNSNDPLFINLRIKSNNKAVYQEVAKTINTMLASKLYTGEVNNETKLKDIMRKIIIVIDKTVRPDYKDHSKCKSDSPDCFDLANYTHLESGSEYLNKFHYTDILNQCSKPVLMKDDNIHTTAKLMKMAVPDKITSLDKPSNPAMKEFIIKHGCQNIFYQYQTVDANMRKTEDLFNMLKGGIVTLSSVITYYAKPNTK